MTEGDQNLSSQIIKGAFRQVVGQITSNGLSPSATTMLILHLSSSVRGYFRFLMSEGCDYVLNLPSFLYPDHHQRVHTILQSQQPCSGFGSDPRRTEFTPVVSLVNSPLASLTVSQSLVRTWE